MIDVAQLGIAFTGATAIMLTQSQHESRRRYACLFGLAGQPFWFATAYTHQQWGVLGLCFLYGFSWAKGVWQWWVRPWLRR